MHSTIQDFWIMRYAEAVGGVVHRRGIAFVAHNEKRWWTQNSYSFAVWPVHGQIESNTILHSMYVGFASYFGGRNSMSEKW